MDILKTSSNVVVTDGNVSVTGCVIEMTSTVDVLKEVLNHKWSLKTLESLGEGEMTFTSLKRALRVSHNPQVSRAVEINVFLGLQTNKKTEEKANPVGRQCGRSTINFSVGYR
jgi:hypothetical protein